MKLIIGEAICGKCGTYNVTEIMIKNDRTINNRCRRCNSGQNRWKWTSIEA